MIDKLGQVMLYVNDQGEAKRFWTEAVGFQVVAEQATGGMRWVEVAPNSGAGTTLVLHNKEAVASMSPGLNLGTPSLMFYTDKLDQLHSRLSEQGITVGEIDEMPFGRVFNFADREENYFAVMEKKA